ncbi:MAG: hypothetical protein CM1200mP13_09390 [Candidatus Pelagibacterales bacterium]|nr:MAG: hypothetical protein CM1200mP13_09390 [Pelagibacterales bacterium]
MGLPLWGFPSIQYLIKKEKKFIKLNYQQKSYQLSFGGANNNDLYITTALKGLKEIDKKKYNLSGSFFKNSN